MQCPRCFWLDARMKITRPNSPPFNINKAIDELFKKEFDVYRAKGEPHPIMIENSIKAIPYMHDDLDTWRETFVGIQYLHEPTNLLVFGGIDDVWVDNETGELLVVDYKATAKDKEVSIDSSWQISYKRQVEVYQWLLRMNGLPVSDVAYFVYANGRMDLDGFNNRVEFTTKLIPYKGSTDWIDTTVGKMKTCMDGDMPPVGDSIMGGPCEFCTYARQRTELTMQALQNRASRSKSA